MRELLDRMGETYPGLKPQLARGVSVAIDGVILPLPKGVAADQIGPGKAAAHTYVNLRPSGLVPPDNVTTWIPLARECEIDADLRVRSVVTWFGLAGPGAGNTEVRSAPCDYFIIVAVPAAKGATS